MANPGSVGLARDTSGLACDAIYEAGRRTLKRIPYDVGATLVALRRATLTDAVIDGLAKVLRPDASETAAKNTPKSVMTQR